MTFLCRCSQDEEIETEHPNKLERKQNEPRKAASEPQMEKKESEKDAQEVAAHNKVRHLNSCTTSPPRAALAGAEPGLLKKKGFCFAITPPPRYPLELEKNGKLCTLVILCMC